MANAHIYTSVTGADTAETIDASVITFPYLKKDHLEIRVSDAGDSLATFKTSLTAGITKLVYGTDYTVSDAGLITFVQSSTFSNGSVYQVQVKRNSDISTRYVDFTDGSVVTEANLDDAQKQQLYLTQELADDKLSLNEDGTLDSLSVQFGDLTDSTVITESEGISSNDVDTALPTSAAVKDYVDTGLSDKAASSHTHTKSEITDLGTIPANLTDLGDTPSSLGSSGQVLKVNSGGTALEFANDDTSSGGSGASDFTDLNDTPSSLTADKWLKVNSGGTALEFTDEPSGGSGEANTASNVGSGSGTEYGVFKQKDEDDLEFKKLKQGSNVTLTENTNDITIAATDTNTTYTAGNGLTLSGEEFSADTGTGSTQVAAGDHNHSGVYEPADADIAKTDTAQTFTAPQRSTFYTSYADDTATFYMNTAQNWTWTVTASGASSVTFELESGTSALTNANGQSGYILLTNSAGTITLNATTTDVDTDLLTTISGATGTFLLSYICDGSKVYLTNSKALT